MIVNLKKFHRVGGICHSGSFGSIQSKRSAGSQCVYRIESCRESESAKRYKNPTLIGKGYRYMGYVPLFYANKKGVLLVVFDSAENTPFIPCKTSISYPAGKIVL